MRNAIRIVFLCGRYICSEDNLIWKFGARFDFMWQLIISNDLFESIE